MSDVTAKIITPPPPPVPDTRRVVLEMPYDVAVTLMRLMCFVGGDMNTSYRVHTDYVFEALEDAGVKEETGRFKGESVCSLWALDIPVTSTE